MLPVGTTAPDFTLPDQSGTMRPLSSLRGRKVVLYFYSRDNTAGCTKQACAFADLAPLFEEKGAVIVGISRDSVESHRKFAEKHGLPFLLLSDPERQVLEKWGVWQEKTSYGKKTMGVVRTTYLIDENGTIIGAFERVKAADNPRDMLDALS